MAKKIFLLVTSLFIVVTVVFYNHQFKPFQGKDKTKETVTTTSSTEKKETVKLPGKVDDWNLVLVNDATEIKEEPKELKALPDGHEVDSRIYTDYLNLTEAAKNEEIDLVIISSYRSVEEQRGVVATEIAQYESQGHTHEEATDLAMKYVTVPGHSEHHTGLALDVLDTTWYNDGHLLEEEFGATKAGQWFTENVCHYGFVIRYEKGKEKITGINYEPWHIRYVGKENAEYMYNNHLALEEYIDQLKK
ncbi:MAG: M15 family metallopeptidase [Vagococcus sp.]